MQTSEASTLQDLIQENGFGPFYYGGREILRRIFVTVRNRSWQEVPPTQWDCTVEEGHGTIRVAARHTSPLVDFEWQGQLDLSEDNRKLRFAFQGKALRDMEICRLGLIVLHPCDTFVGAKLTTRGPDGSHELTVPETISAQPIVNGLPSGMVEPFSSSTVEMPDFGKMEFRFEGELFELEDQRNWGDASFKTYCTPLRLGFPRKMAKDTQVAHRVEIAYSPSAPQKATIDNSLQALQVGRVAPATLESADKNWLQGWSHIRLDVDAASIGNLESVLAQLPRNTKLELAITVGESSDISAAVVEWLAQHAGRIAALLVRNAKSPLPNQASIVRLRKALANTSASEVPLFAYPNGYFSEYNRNQKFELDVDGIAFPLTTTVHGDDALTIIENTERIAAMVETARTRTGKQRVRISPLALYYPKSANADRFPRRLITPWLATMTAQLTKAGAESITLGEDLLEKLGS